MMTYADPDGEPWNTNMVVLFPNAGEIETDLNEYRNSEKNNVFAISANGAEFSIIYSLKSEVKIEAGINIWRTIWVVIVLTVAAVHFTNAINRLVLNPLARMLEVVKKIAKDPSSAAAKEEMQNAGIYMYLKQQDGVKKTEENMETHILEQAIQKIGHLLTLGFGDAGSSIIA